MSQAALAQGVVEFIAEGVAKVLQAQNEIIAKMQAFATKGMDLATVNFQPKGANKVAETAANMTGKLTGFGGVAGRVLRGVGGLFTSVGKGASQFAATVNQSFTSATKVAAGFAAVGVLAFAKFGSAAMSGTVEGKRFGMAIEFVQRVVGGMFAPVIRMATTGLVAFGRWFAAIPNTTKFVAGALLAVGVAVSAVAALWPVLAAAIGPVLGILGAFLSPVGLIVAGLGALGAYLLVGQGYFNSWSSTIAFVSQVALTAWDAMGMAWSALWEGVMGIWASSGQVVLDAVSTGWQIASQIIVSSLEWVLGAWMSFFGSMSGDAITIGSIVATIAEAWMDVYSVIETVGGVLYELLLPAFQAIGEVVSYVYSSVIVPVFNAIMGQFNTMTGGITITWKTAMKFIGDVLLGVVLVIAQGINFVGKVFGVAVGAIISTLAYLGEKVGVISSATAEKMRAMADASRNLKLVDTDALTNRLGAASNAIDQKMKANATTAKALASTINQSVGGAMKMVSQSWEKNGVKGKAIAAGVSQAFKSATSEGGFKKSMDVGFEGIGGTFERLQKSFAADPGLSIEESQLKALEANNDLQRQVVENTSRIVLVGK